MATKRRFVLIWIACVVGAWSIIPYLLFANIVPPSVSFGKLFLICTLQAALLYALLLWATFYILPKTDLTPFPTGNFLRRVFWPGILSGFLVGLLIFILEKTLFHSSTLSKIHPPAWAGALASVYGGVNEEVLLRLFLFSFLYFLLLKVCKPETRSRSYFLWGVNILVALVFGLGHLPAAFKIAEPSTFEVVRVLMLNGIPGIVFGWLYWSRGFYTAVTAHFCTDIMIHVC